MPNPVLSAALFYKAGTSDKEYRVTVEEVSGGHVVNYAYGRRGAELRPGSITPTPLTLLAATIEFNRLIAEKTGKGYKPDPAGPPLDNLMQTRQGRRLGFATAELLQEELWSRKYTHPWGKREEWATLLNEHPEILELPPKEAADTVLANIAQWSPLLAAKELKARAATEEQLRKNREVTARLNAAKVNETRVGPPEAKVSICQFADDHLLPPLRADVWAALSEGVIRFVEAGEADARVRAERLVELSRMTVESSFRFPTDDTWEFSVRLINAPKVSPGEPLLPPLKL